MDCGDSSQSYFFSPPNNLTLYPDHAPASSRTASYTSQARVTCEDINGQSHVPEGHERELVRELR